MADETTAHTTGTSPIDFGAPTGSGAPGGAPRGGGAGATCRKCAAPVTGYYYESAGAVYCPKCRHAAETASNAASGRGGGMGRAALFGFGAAVVGAVGYWAFIRLTNWDWALVSIAVGMLVATAIRKGNGNRGGRRYQFLAVVLTYLAIGGAYAPFAITGVMKGIEQGEAKHAAAAAKQRGTTAARSEAAPSYAATDRPSSAASSSAAAPSAKGTKAAKLSAGQRLLVVVVGVLMVVVSAPMAIIALGFPGSIINILIVGFALHRAWQMMDGSAGDAGPTFSGPYNVKSRPVAPSSGV